MEIVQNPPLEGPESKKESSFEKWLHWSEENNIIPDQELAKIREDLPSSCASEVLTFLGVATSYDYAAGTLIKILAAREAIQEGLWEGVFDFTVKYGIKLGVSYAITMLLVNTTSKKMDVNYRESLRILIPAIGSFKLADHALLKHPELGKSIEVYWMTAMRRLLLKWGIFSKSEFFSEETLVEITKVLRKRERRETIFRIMEAQGLSTEKKIEDVEVAKEEEVEKNTEIMPVAKLV